jgi:hypothetical protein
MENRAVKSRCFGASMASLPATHASHASHGKPGDSSSAVSCLCFSKDRPFQLREFLRTFLLFAEGAPVHVTVLYTFT